MTFEQIRYFLALADEGSFVRAARRCGISQPSLSNAIRSLETALGAPLFERAVAGSALTALGRRMHPLLARLYHDKLRALQFARRACRDHTRRLGQSGAIVMAPSLRRSTSVRAVRRERTMA